MVKFKLFPWIFKKCINFFIFHIQPYFTDSSAALCNWYLANTQYLSGNTGNIQSVYVCIKTN